MAGKFGAMGRQPQKVMDQIGQSIRCSAWFSLFLFFASCGEGLDHHDDGFVTMDEKGFRLQGRRHFPLIVNYSVELRLHADSLWACPGDDYDVDTTDLPHTFRSDAIGLQADMEMVHDLGFNGVRLVGFGETLQHDSGTFVRARTVWMRDTLVPIAEHYDHYLVAVERVLDAARSAGLHAIITVYVRPEQLATEEHFIRIADRFRNDPVVFAYDLNNEPLYFDKPERKKEDVVAICSRWREFFNAHAPNQLFTIGLVGIRETFEWDPNILAVDFISFHPYEHEPEQVRNELRWYSEHVQVPWIIGETAIPADNDSVSYQIQREFARKTLLQARACGAWGYSWWQYKDVDWDYFHSDFMGALDREGVTHTSKSRFTIRGSPKPVSDVFRSFDPMTDPGPCICLPNYRNYSEGRVCKITGRLMDHSGRPINNGVVIAWNEEWNSSHHTTTDPDGRFELLGTFWLHHWMASAMRFSMDRGDSAPNGYRRGADGIPAYEVGDITLERLIREQ